MPHSVGDDPLVIHQSKKDHPARDEAALAVLDALDEAWLRQIASKTPPLRTARNIVELAQLFSAILGKHPQLHGYWLDWDWVETVYPAFGRGAYVDWGSLPPYKDFARELAKVMTRSRIEKWQDGRRLWVRTMYLVEAQDRAVRIKEACAMPQPATHIDRVA
jgi:hypothetical protein